MQSGSTPSGMVAPSRSGSVSQSNPDMGAYMGPAVGVYGSAAGYPSNGMSQIRYGMTTSRVRTQTVSDLSSDEEDDEDADSQDGYDERRISSGSMKSYGNGVGAGSSLGASTVQPGLLLLTRTNSQPAVPKPVSGPLGSPTAHLLPQSSPTGSMPGLPARVMSNQALLGAQPPSRIPTSTGLGALVQAVHNQPNIKNRYDTLTANGQRQVAAGKVTLNPSLPTSASMSGVYSQLTTMEPMAEEEMVSARDEQGGGPTKRVKGVNLVAEDALPPSPTSSASPSSSSQNDLAANFAGQGNPHQSFGQGSQSGMQFQAQSQQQQRVNIAKMAAANVVAKSYAAVLPARQQFSTAGLSGPSGASPTNQFQPLVRTNSTNPSTMSMIAEPFPDMPPTSTNMQGMAIGPTITNNAMGAAPSGAPNVAIPESSVPHDQSNPLWGSRRIGITRSLTGNAASIQGSPVNPAGLQSQTLLRVPTGGNNADGSRRPARTPSMGGVSPTAASGMQAVSALSNPLNLGVLTPRYTFSAEEHGQAAMGLVYHHTLSTPGGGKPTALIGPTAAVNAMRKLAIIKANQNAHDAAQGIPILPFGIRSGTTCNSCSREAHLPVEYILRCSIWDRTMLEGARLYAERLQAQHRANGQQSVEPCCTDVCPFCPPVKSEGDPNIKLERVSSSAVQRPRDGSVATGASSPPLDVLSIKTEPGSMVVENQDPSSPSSEASEKSLVTAAPAPGPAQLCHRMCFLVLLTVQTSHLVPPSPQQTTIQSNSVTTSVIASAPSDMADGHPPLPISSHAEHEKVSALALELKPSPSDVCMGMLASPPATSQGGVALPAPDHTAHFAAASASSTSSAFPLYIQQSAVNGHITPQPNANFGITRVGTASGNTMAASSSNQLAVPASLVGTIVPGRRLSGGSLAAK